MIDDPLPLVLLLLLLASACDGATKAGEASKPGCSSAEGAPQVVSVGELVKDPESYAGCRVRVEAQSHASPPNCVLVDGEIELPLELRPTDMCHPTRVSVVGVFRSSGAQARIEVADIQYPQGVPAPPPPTGPTPALEALESR